MVLPLPVAGIVPAFLVSMIPALQFDNWQWLALQLATPVVLWGAWLASQGLTTVGTVATLAVYAEMYGSPTFAATEAIMRCVCSQ